MSEMQHEALRVLAEVWALADELIAVLYRHRTELSSRLEGVANPALPPTGTATSVSGSSTLPEATPATEL